MFCKNCGAQNNDNAEFCISCGTILRPSSVQPPVSNTSFKGLSIASMVLGIVSLALFCLWYLAIPCGIVALALGGISFSKAKQVGAKNPMAIAGLACGCVAIGLAILFILLAAIGMASTYSMFY